MAGGPYLKHFLGLEKRNHNWESWEGDYPVWLGRAANEKIQMSRIQEVTGQREEENSVVWLAIHRARSYLLDTKGRYREG